MKCKICRQKEAEVPDRNKPWSRRKEICGECHANRLRGDFAKILEIEQMERGHEKNIRRNGC